MRQRTMSSDPTSRDDADANDDGTMPNHWMSYLNAEDSDHQFGNVPMDWNLRDAFYQTHMLHNEHVSSSSSSSSAAATPSPSTSASVTTLEQDPSSNNFSHSIFAPDLLTAPFYPDLAGALPPSMYDHSVNLVGSRNDQSFFSTLPPDPFDMYSTEQRATGIENDPNASCVQDPPTHDPYGWYQHPPAMTETNLVTGFRRDNNDNDDHRFRQTGGHIVSSSTGAMVDPSVRHPNPHLSVNTQFSIHGSNAGALGRQFPVSFPLSAPVPSSSSSSQSFAPLSGPSSPLSPATHHDVHPLSLSSATVLTSHPRAHRGRRPRSRGRESGGRGDLIFTDDVNVRNIENESLLSEPRDSDSSSSGSTVTQSPGSGNSAGPGAGVGVATTQDTQMDLVRIQRMGAAQGRQAILSGAMPPAQTMAIQDRSPIQASLRPASVVHPVASTSTRILPSLTFGIRGSERSDDDEDSLGSGSDGSRKRLRTLSPSSNSAPSAASSPEASTSPTRRLPRHSSMHTSDLNHEQTSANSTMLPMESGEQIKSKRKPWRGATHPALIVQRSASVPQGSHGPNEYTRPVEEAYGVSGLTLQTPEMTSDEAYRSTQNTFQRIMSTNAAMGDHAASQPTPASSSSASFAPSVIASPIGAEPSGASSGTSTEYTFEVTSSESHRRSGSNHDLDDRSSSQGRTGRVFPHETTQYLRNWILEHEAHPYPTGAEKQELCERTGLSWVQLDNWFINARRRVIQKPARPPKPLPRNKRAPTSSSSSSTGA